MRSYPEAEYLTLLDVLEHQEDDRMFMEELVAKMEPAATLIVTVPALSSLWSRWDEALGHYRRYDKRAMRDCVRGLPVELVELSYLFPELVAPALVRKLTTRSSEGAPSEEEASFPDPPKAVNTGLYALGRASLKLRRRAPFGSSLLAVLRRT